MKNHRKQGCNQSEIKRKGKSHTQQSVQLQSLELTKGYLIINPWIIHKYTETLLNCQITHKKVVQYYNNMSKQFNQRICQIIR